MNKRNSFGNITKNLRLSLMVLFDTKFPIGVDGFGGLVVSMLASGSNPAEAVGFLRA